ncbi:MAG: PilZ domain-containing protein [Treponema sp.]|nr:PilZ domain-containing protein [Treponema sp.]
MYTLVVVIIFLLVLIFMGFIFSVFRNKIRFFITGFDEGFSASDLNLLWKVSQLCELQQPTSLFYSLPALTKCIGQISTLTSADGEDKNQKIMTKLFDYRTKLQNEADDKKGLQTTTTLEKGQKLRIILPGKGVFATEITANASFLVVNVPKQKDIIVVPAEEWVGKVISVYLWRKGDARYVFDTTVTQAGLYIGKSSLFLQHSNNLIRTQKRKAVRAKCDIPGDLFIVRKENLDYSAVETQNGYHCKIVDISESGAQIKIGGKGVENIIIKIQFNIQNKLIIMSGIVRTVEYNEEDNQSLLHIECTHIEPSMKNEILSFVYQILPTDEKEIIQAIEQTDEDNAIELENETANQENENNKVEKLEENANSNISAASNNVIDNNQSDKNTEAALDIEGELEEL